MELETDITNSGVHVRAWAEPQEAAAYVLALLSAQQLVGPQNGTQMALDGLGEGGRQPAGRVEYQGRPFALAAVPAPEPPAPAPEPEAAPAVLRFNVPSKIRDLCGEAGVDLKIFDHAVRTRTGPGLSYIFTDLTADDAITLYETFSVALKRGAGKNYPGFYSVRARLQKLLDNHFHIPPAERRVDVKGEG